MRANRHDAKKTGVSVDQDRADQAGIKVLAHHDREIVARGRASDVAIHDSAHDDVVGQGAVALQQCFNAAPDHRAKTSATIVREVGHALGKQ